MEHRAIRILLAGGRTVGHPVWDLGEEGLSTPDSVVNP